MDDEFTEAFNEELHQLGCGARIRLPKESWHRGSIEIVDLDGAPIGIVPSSTNPIEMAAFMRLIEKAFADGFAAGRKSPGTEPS